MVHPCAACVGLERHTVHCTGLTHTVASTFKFMGSVVLSSNAHSWHRRCQMSVDGQPRRRKRAGNHMENTPKSNVVYSISPILEEV